MSRDTQMTSSQVCCNHAALLEIEQTKNRELQERVHQLEQKVSEMTEVLDHQMGSVLRKSLQVVDDPDTLEHFDSFSIDTAITELKSNAPDVDQLMMIFGKTNRNWTPGDDSINTEQRCAIMSICTLLKARSVRGAS